ncbi:hypothetical protein OUZ56_026588 [Daphnia magna]|uniref:Uncharacterized protein n=1 Tax=Daphnia magna TaxID=35525 RepID=A0ABQ9ZM82_9CRUS|nr:hypothetical protein OUZ56_026584 [Daphnia magna]KAK4014042.1 hypothetical protein OUZ56_026588 [Daphnia magna]
MSSAHYKYFPYPEDSALILNRNYNTSAWRAEQGGQKFLRRSYAGFAWPRRQALTVNKPGFLDHGRSQLGHRHLGQTVGSLQSQPRKQKSNNFSF